MTDKDRKVAKNAQPFLILNGSKNIILMAGIRLNLKTDRPFSEFRASIEVLNKKQMCDPVALRSVNVTVSKVDTVFENSSAIFTANIDGPSKPTNVVFHHIGTSNKT